MKKCKVCGELFSFHVTNTHLETHGLTRAEYNALPGREDTFIIKKSNYDKFKADADNYVLEAIRRNKKKNNRYNSAKV